MHCYLDISYWHVFHPLHQRSEVNSTGLPNSFGTPLYCAASVWLRWPSLARDNILGLSFFEITILVPLGINCSMLHSSLLHGRYLLKASWSHGFPFWRSLTAKSSSSISEASSTSRVVIAQEGRIYGYKSDIFFGFSWVTAAGFEISH